MLKGINRNVIVVRGNGHSRFESVYFVMKRGTAAEKRELADEAQKLIGESGLCHTASKKRFKSITLFAIGAAAGFFISSVLWLTLILS